MAMSQAGRGLHGVTKDLFIALRREIDEYNAHEVIPDNILNVLDVIDEIQTKEYMLCVPILHEGVLYLRELLLNPDPEVVFHTLTLLDFIVKNSGFVLHCLIGRREFMQTIVGITRKFTDVRPVDNKSKKVGSLALDCVQAWAEAFEQRQGLYPHICQVYADLRHKYHMHFPKPAHDPSRVPILLGEISHAEKNMATAWNRNTEIDYRRLEEKPVDDEPPRKIRKIAPLAPVPMAPVLPTPSNMGGEMVAIFRQELDRLAKKHAPAQLPPQQGSRTTQQQNRRIVLPLQQPSSTSSSQPPQGQSVTCAVCFDTPAESEGFLCTQKCGTFTCWDCLLQCYTMAAKPDAIQGSSNTEGELLCSEIKCRFPLTVTDLAKSSASEAVLKAQEGFKIPVLTAKKVEEALNQQEVRIRAEYARIEQIKDADEKAAAKLRMKIVDEVLTLRCPRCKTAFVDFDGCSALFCSNRNCRCAFCAMCLKDCGHDAHGHLMVCPENASKDIYSTEISFNQHHKQKRMRGAQTLIKDAGLTNSATEKLKELMRADFADLDIEWREVLPTDPPPRAKRHRSAEPTEERLPRRAQPFPDRFYDRRDEREERPRAARSPPRRADVPRQPYPAPERADGRRGYVDNPARAARSPPRRPLPRRDEFFDRPRVPRQRDLDRQERYYRPERNEHVNEVPLDDRRRRDEYAPLPVYLAAPYLPYQPYPQFVPYPPYP